MDNYTFHYNVRKCSFCPSIVNVELRNSLSIYNTVADVDTVLFKCK